MTTQNQEQTASAARIELADAARHLRERLGLSLRAAAAELGISHVHLSRIESGESSPTGDVIEKFYECWGIDLYMVAVSLCRPRSDFPKSLQNATARLQEAWGKQIERVIQSRNAS